jgi:ribosome biogenesis GTPase
MSNKKKKQKIRARFKKNREVRTRTTDWTRQYDQHQFEDEDTVSSERISGKGDLTRSRTVRGLEVDDANEPGFGIYLDVDEKSTLPGRVLAVRGLISVVESEDGQIYECATRRLLKTLDTEQRHVVVAGDLVRFRRVENTDQNTHEGIIERIEPRHGCVCRTSRGRQHIIVTNVDQVFIVASAAEPRLKPNLIDRVLVTAEKSRIEPVILINKVDLVDPALLQPIVGNYAQLGYKTMLVSAETGFGLDAFRRRLTNRESVVTGQSGVGKSSLLNKIDPNLQLRVSAVSAESQKGRHTTTTAELLPLSSGGYVVDTPGIRQFQLWDVIPEEVPGFYREFRPYVSFCRYPDCTHTHEDDCAVKDAVADGRIDERRYESYCHMIEEE